MGGSKTARQIPGGQDVKAAGLPETWRNWKWVVNRYRKRQTFLDGQGKIACVTCGWSSVTLPKMTPNRPRQNARSSQNERIVKPTSGFHQLCGRFRGCNHLIFVVASSLKNVTPDFQAITVESKNSEINEITFTSLLGITVHVHGVNSCNNGGRDLIGWGVWKKTWWEQSDGKLFSQNKLCVFF